MGRQESRGPEEAVADAIQDFPGTLTRPRIDDMPDQILRLSVASIQTYRA